MAAGKVWQQRTIMVAVGKNNNDKHIGIKYKNNEK